MRANHLFCVGLLICSPVWAQTFNATADWSDAANPNGVWSYLGNGITLPAVIRGSDPWGVPQKSWGDLPGWFRSNGSELFTHDWIAGDIVTHSGVSDLRWTSSLTGLVDVSGAVWPARDIGRSNDWSVRVNGTPVTGGVVASGDPYSRSNPYVLSSGGGGPAALSSIPVSVGDTIELRIAASPGSIPDYAGARFTVTVIPEPASVASLLGLLTLQGRRSRQRR